MFGVKGGGGEGWRRGEGNFSCEIVICLSSVCLGVMKDVISSFR